VNDSFQNRLTKKMSEGSISSRSRDPSPLSSSFDDRLHKKLSGDRGGSFRSSGISKPGAVSSSSAVNDSFQNRLTKKMSEGSISSRSRDPSPLSSSFDDRLHKKLSGDRTSNQSSTFEERLQRKLSEEKRSSAVKGSSFDERLQSKLSSQGSSRSLLSNQSSLTFEERLQRKLGDEDRKLSGGNRSSSKSSEGRFKDAYQRAQSLSMRMKIEKSNKKKSEKKDSEAKEDSSRRK